MSSDFTALFDFLDRFGPEVCGRALLAPPSAAAARLQRFASGMCDDEERAKICKLLQEHPGWMRWLAEQVKTARTSNGSKR